MARIPGIGRRLFRPADGTQRIEADVDAELTFHFEMTVRELIAHGATRADAEREARRRFGDLDRARDAMRRLDRARAGQERRAAWWSAAVQDLRYALRGLRKSPGFTAVVTATLALGIGANAAMFGVVDRLLLRPPAHVARPDRIVRLYQQVREPTTDDDGVMSAYHYPGFLALRSEVSDFADVAAHFSSSVTFGSGARAAQRRVTLVTGTFFTLLGVTPELGRFIGPADDRPPVGEPVIVLGYGLWQREFGSDRSVLGRDVEVNGRRFTVIGVAPKAFNGLELSAIDGWVPFSAMAGQMLNADSDGWMRDENWFWLEVVARLAPDGDARHAAAMATTINRRLLASAHRPDSATSRMLFGSIIAERGPSRSQQARVAEWLGGVSILVLLIACANVANLLLARAVRRRREIAVRVALGIGRARLIGQLFIESLVLAALGAAGALLIARGAGQLIRVALLPDLSPDLPVVDGHVLLFTAAVALGTGLLTGLAPAMLLGTPRLTSALRGGAREGGMHHSSRFRTLLLVTQAAFCVILLVGAGLFVRSLRKAATLDLGYDADRVVVADVDFSGRGMKEPERLAFFDRALERVRALPVVSSASLGVTLPFAIDISTSLTIPGRDSMPRVNGRPPSYNAVTSDFFATLGLQLRRGRTLNRGDRTGAPYVAVVNESMAHRLWPRQEAVGQCIKVGADTMPCTTVVGVVEDSYDGSLRGTRPSVYYMPIDATTASAPPLRTLFVRARGDTRVVIEAVRHELQAMMPDLPFVNVRVMRDLIEPEVRPWRLGASMFGIFGALALVLAAVGLYSAIAYDVAQRVTEIGVRVALGATSRNVVGHVVRQGLRVVLAGIAIGAAVALGAGGAIASLLYELPARDWQVYAVVVATLITVSVLACLVPAWRASRVDPAIALRGEG